MVFSLRGGLRSDLSWYGRIHTRAQRGYSGVVAVSLVIRILGPLEVDCAGRPIPVGQPKQRVVLAMLAMEPNQTIPLGRLINAVWDRPPVSAVANVRTHISALRRLLGRCGGAIETVGGGYRLRLDGGQVDASTYDRLAAQGRAALAGGAFAEAAHLLAASLRLWRGEAGCDMTGGPALRYRLVALNEQRLFTQEELFAARLATGGPMPPLIAQLRAFLADHPLREHTWHLLVLALSLAGDTAGALASYRAAARVFAEELGLEPGRRLTELHTAILRREVGPAAELVRPWL
jgi:DNA-binding SARP family transcriptional activator